MQGWKCVISYDFVVVCFINVIQFINGGIHIHLHHYCEFIVSKMFLLKTKISTKAIKQKKKRNP